MAVGVPVCSPIVPDATVPESPITLRTQVCTWFLSLVFIFQKLLWSHRDHSNFWQNWQFLSNSNFWQNLNDKVCLLKTGNKTANITVKNCSLYTLLTATDWKQFLIYFLYFCQFCWITHACMYACVRACGTMYVRVSWVSSMCINDVMRNAAIAGVSVLRLI